MIEEAQTVELVNTLTKEREAHRDTAHLLAYRQQLLEQAIQKVERRGAALKALAEYEPTDDPVENQRLIRRIANLADKAYCDP